MAETLGALQRENDRLRAEYASIPERGGSLNVLVLLAVLLVLGLSGTLTGFYLGWVHEPASASIRRQGHG